MLINIDLDDALVEEAFRLVPVSTERELVHLALKELIESRRLDMRDLLGADGIRPDYDYKRLREDS